MKREDERLPLDSTDAHFAAKLAELYAPEPQTLEQRQAFARGLEARLSGRGYRRAWFPALASAAACAAAALTWLLVSPGSTPTRTATDSAVAGGASQKEWEAQLFYPDQLMGRYMEDVTTPRTGGLPDEYMAIASAFLDE